MSEIWIKKVWTSRLGDMMDEQAKQITEAAVWTSEMVESATRRLSARWVNEPKQDE